MPVHKSTTVSPLPALTKSDKKADSGFVKFTLLKKLGNAVIDSTVTDEEILAAINEIYFDEQENA